MGFKFEEVAGDSGQDDFFESLQIKDTVFNGAGDGLIEGLFRVGAFDGQKSL
jgi:hypothetical protein